MLEPKDDLDRRYPVWLALSDLFLDTELQEYHFTYVARILAESRYSDEEVSYILFREVFPVCIDNLRHVAGEWAGFPGEWLQERILNFPTCGRRLPISEHLIKMIDGDWRKVQALLPEARQKVNALGS